MKTQHFEWVKIARDGCPAIVVPRAWWTWVVYCSGSSTRQVAEEVCVPRSYVKCVLSRARKEWGQRSNFQDPLTWN